MFVVRVVVDDDTIDFKVFERKEDAESRYWSAYRQTDEGEFESVTIFEVADAPTPREAVDAVKRADRSVQLLEIKEPFQKDIEKLVSELDSKI